MGGDPAGGLHQGTPVGYRLIVTKTGDRRYGAEAVCETMTPLLGLLEQFEGIDYEFVKIERVYGG